MIPPDFWLKAQSIGRAAGLVAILWASLPAFADVSGRVVGVLDGDTIKVLDSNQVQHTIRLMGIDAPEKGQPFGQKSKQALSDCSYGQIATVLGSKRDKWGRLIGKVMVQERDCNLHQLQLGMAWHYTAYKKEQTKEDRSLYEEAQELAKTGRLGLWSDSHPIEPWVFRHK